VNPRLNFIFSRRSIRNYEDREIPETVLHDLLEAAMAAPSAVAKDPWEFIVLRRRASLEAVADVLPHGQMLRRAGAGIIVCGDVERAHDKQESYLLQDLSAATENLLLAATALGLGSCWLGVHPRTERIEGLRRLFRLPANIIPMCGVSLGWPAERPEARTRFNPTRVHGETW